jgi:hypothetical protein
MFNGGNEKERLAKLKMEDNLSSGTNWFFGLLDSFYQYHNTNNCRQLKFYCRF